jgi:hypothetical protein
MSEGFLAERTRFAHEGHPRVSATDLHSIDDCAETVIIASSLDQKKSDALLRSVSAGLPSQADDTSAVFEAILASQTTAGSFDRGLPSPRLNIAHVDRCLSIRPPRTFRVLVVG